MWKLWWKNWNVVSHEYVENNLINKYWEEELREEYGVRNISTLIFLILQSRYCLKLIIQAIKIILFYNIKENKIHLKNKQTETVMLKKKD